MTRHPFYTRSLRSDFPIFNKLINSKSLVYLDNAASTQKPQSVIESMNRFYSNEYSNVHRGIHSLSEQATQLFEQARTKIQHFIHANYAEEIIFVRGTTEAINLVAQSYLPARLKTDDEILISYMEHHANIVPWQRVCTQTGAKLKVIPITPTGELDLDSAEALLTDKTRLLSIVHLSNVLGTLNPIKQLIALAHRKNIPVLVDGAQAVAHLPINVKDLDCDFYAFSGHKMYGPNGIGILYGKRALLEKMPPWQTGGGMIQQVTFEKTEYRESPYRFEAGTPAIVEAVGLGATVDYLRALDFKALMEHEKQTFEYALDRFKEIPQLSLIGQASERHSVLSFVFKDIHAHDVATILNEEGIAVRAGHHCAMPLVKYFKVPSTVRVSFALYNTQHDVDRLITALQKTRKLLS